MIRRKTVKSKNLVNLTFVIPHQREIGPVSVVGDFNAWTPGVHTLARRSNGTRSVTVAVPAGSEQRFRYLGDGGLWFDDPDADAHDGHGGLIRA